MKLTYYEHDYETEKVVRYDVVDGDRFTVRVKPEAAWPGYVVLETQDGQRFPVNATFDLSKTPESMRPWAVEILRLGHIKATVPPELC